MSALQTITVVFMVVLMVVVVVVVVCFYADDDNNQNDDDDDDDDDTQALFRRDEIDSRHYPVFHQMDGVRTWEKSSVPGDDQRVMCDV